MPHIDQPVILTKKNISIQYTSKKSRWTLEALDHCFFNNVLKRTIMLKIKNPIDYMFQRYVRDNFNSRWLNSTCAPKTHPLSLVCSIVLTTRV